MKAYRSPTPAGVAVADAPVTAPHVAPRAAVPLSQALAELAATSTVPPETIAAEPAITAPVASEAVAAPVGPSIAALLDQSYEVTTVDLSNPLADEAEKSALLSAETTAVSSAPVPSQLAHTAAISESSGPAPWRPLLQVDRVVWPSVHNRLQATAPAAIQQMADGLLSICAAGNKVVGLASCTRGEGVTTLLLAAAQKLQCQGRKVVLVDADWSNPQLAQSLGLLPQIGWEETLCGGLPLEEVVIESLADGLAVLPVREPSESSIAQAQIAATFEILAREFDLVLVDLGPLDEVRDGNAALGEVAARMDAVVLVQNVRVTTPNRLAEVRQRLAASNLRHACTIQNFVAG